MSWQVSACEHNLQVNTLTVELAKQIAENDFSHGEIRGIEAFTPAGFDDVADTNAESRKKILAFENRLPAAVLEQGEVEQNRKHRPQQVFAAAITEIDVAIPQFIGNKAGRRQGADDESGGSAGDGG